MFLELKPFKNRWLCDFYWFLELFRGCGKSCDFVTFSLLVKFKPFKNRWLCDFFDVFRAQTIKKRMTLWLVLVSGTLQGVGRVVTLRVVTLRVVTLRVVTLCGVCFKTSQSQEKSQSHRFLNGLSSKSIKIITKSSVFKWFELPKQWISHKVIGF